MKGKFVTDEWGIVVEAFREALIVVIFAFLVLQLCFWFLEARRQVRERKTGKMNRGLRSWDNKYSGADGDDDEGSASW